MRMTKSSSSSSSLFLFLCLLIVFVANAADQVNGLGRLVKREERRQIAVTDYGTISAVDIGFEDNDDNNPSKQAYQLQFINLDPNSIFLPALLHADMVLYVQTGSGKLSYTDGKEMEETKVTKGDVYRLKSGSVFYIQSSQQTQSEDLRLFALFSDAGGERKETWVGPYSGIRDLFQGFDTRLLQTAFQAPEEVMEEIMTAADMAPIVEAHAKSNQKLRIWNKETTILKTLLKINGVDNDFLFQRNKKKHKKDKHKEETSINLFKAKRTVENCDGWTARVTPKDLHDDMEGLSIEAFIVNLKTGAMAGPHWNPSATVIAVVVEGRGMVRAVCASSSTREECNNTRFVVKKGDVFAIPRYHPMAEMSFNNESLVLVGFYIPTQGTSSGPLQFLAGKDSFLNVLDKRVLELALSVNSTTINRLLGSKTESIKECISCAEEEEERLIEEESREERQKRPEEEEEERQRRPEEEEEERRRRPEEEEEETRRRPEEEEEERRRSPKEEEGEERRRRPEEEEGGERRRRPEEEERRRRPEEEEEDEDEDMGELEREERERGWESWDAPGTRARDARKTYMRRAM